MTREAIEYFKFRRKIFCEDYLKICPKDSIAYQATLKEKEFYDMTIKALEQEPILDKVKQAREDIKNLTPWDEGLVEMYEVLAILDKLIESEE